MRLQDRKMEKKRKMGERREKKEETYKTSYYRGTYAGAALLALANGVANRALSVPPHGTLAIFRILLALAQ